MTFSVPIRASAKESLQAAKWQKIPVLLDYSEMEELFSHLGEFYIVKASGLIPDGEELISQMDFLKAYKVYIEDLAHGQTPVLNERERAFFTAVLTTTSDALYKVKVNEQQCLVKMRLPIIQMQSHRFDYFTADNSFRSMVMGFDAIAWGIQFSYPSICQNETMEVVQIREGDGFPNTPLFKKLQRWTRTATIATPIVVEGKVVNVPIRIGKKCLPWINQHPQLKERGLLVSVSTQ